MRRLFLLRMNWLVSEVGDGDAAEVALCPKVGRVGVSSFFFFFSFFFSFFFFFLFPFFFFPLSPLFLLFFMLSFYSLVALNAEPAVLQGERGKN